MPSLYVFCLWAFGTVVGIFYALFPQLEMFSDADSPDFSGAVALSLRLLFLIGVIAATNKYREQWELLQAAKDYAENGCSLESFGSATKDILKRF